MQFGTVIEHEGTAFVFAQGQRADEITVRFLTYFGYGKVKYEALANGNAKTKVTSPESVGDGHTLGEVESDQSPNDNYVVKLIAMLPGTDAVPNRILISVNRM